MLKSYYENFINALFIKIKDFESFNSFIIFFNFESEQKNRNKFEILSLFEKFKTIKNNLKVEKKDYYKKIIKLFLCLYHYNIKNKINDIFNELEISPKNYKKSINLLFSYIDNCENNQLFLKAYIFNFIQRIYHKYFIQNYSFILYLFQNLKTSEINELYSILFPNLEKSLFYNDIFLKLIETNKINEIQILSIINLFWDNLDNKNKDKEILVSLIKNINYKQIENNYYFKTQFFNSNFSRFREYYYQLINHLFTQIKDLESFNFFIKFFDFNNNYQYRNKYEILNLFERFKFIKNQLNIDDIKRILKIFFILFHHNIRNQMDIIYNFKIESVDYLIPINILTDFIKNMNGIESFIKDYSMNYLKIIFDRSFKENYDFIFHLFDYLEVSNIMNIYNLLFPDFRNSLNNFYKNKISMAIKNKKIKGTKILSFIILFWKKFNNNDIEKKTLISLIEDLDYKDIKNDKNFKSLFFNSNFTEFGIYYKDLINALFSKINSLESFNFYLNFFDFENNQKKRNLDEISCFFESFKKIRSSLNKINMQRIIKIFICLFYYNSQQKQQIEQIFIELDNWTVNSEDIIHILTNLINNCNLTESFLKKYIEEYFIKKITEKQNDDYILMILINLEDLDLLDKILKLKFLNEINENDFYKNMKSQNKSKYTINFLVKLSSTKLFQNDKYYNISTIKIIKETINKVYSKLKNYNINLKKANEIINTMDNNELKKRFIIIENGNLNNANDGLNNFKLKIQDCNNFILKLKEVILFLNTFFGEKDTIIDNYSKKLQNIENFMISNNFFNGDQDFNKYYNLSQNYKNFYKSLFFIGILETIKKDCNEKHNHHINNST